MAVKIIKCAACNADISNQAEKCPHCGHPNAKAKKPAGCLQVIGGLVVFFIVIGFLAGGNDKLANHEMQKIENQVANDAVAQYDIAKKQGDKMQICVQAGLVSAAFLQAKDDLNYNQWKATEKSDCKAAGLPAL